jgi:hypothetical protein
MSIDGGDQISVYLERLGFDESERTRIQSEIQGNTARATIRALMGARMATAGRVPMAVTSWLADRLRELSESGKTSIDNVIDGLSDEQPENVIPAVKEAMTELCDSLAADAAQAAADW